MDSKRQGEIALMLIKYHIRKQGTPRISRENMRELGNVAKAIDIPVEELKRFTKPLIQEALDECFFVN